MTAASGAAAGRLRIAEVSRSTGIPVTTLRFYEKELPGLFPIRKTRGGHRRYEGRDVRRFEAVRRLTREGVRLADVRRVIMSRGEGDALRDDVDMLLDVHHTGIRLLEDVTRRLEDLEARMARLETSAPRRRWLPRFPRE